MSKPLWEVARDGDKAEVARRIQQGANLEETNQVSRTLLTTAITFSAHGAGSHWARCGPC